MSKKKKKQNSNKSRQSSPVSKQSAVVKAEQAQELQTSKSVANSAENSSATVQNVEQKVDCTYEQVNEIVDELAATPKRQRIWEIDFVRGLMILFVVWDHFMWDVNSINVKTPYNTALFQWLYELSKSYYKGVLRKVTHDVFVSMFVLTSGISCSFSRHNGKRALKMVVFALLFSAVTYALAEIMQSPDMTIYFNVIHVIALSVLLYSGIEWLWARCTKNWQKNIFGCVMFAITITALVVGSCAKAQPWTNENRIWYFLAEHSSTIKSYRLFKGGDYLNFLPDFGWFLVGVFLGRIIYREKKSVFPSVNAKYVAPITFCGRHSLWVYFISQVVMYGFIYLLHDMYLIL